MTTSSSLVSTYPLFKVMTVLTYVFCWKCMWSSLYYADFIWSVPFLVRWCPIVHCNTYEVNGSLQSQNPIFHHQNDPYALSTLSCSQQQCTVSCGVKPKRCINWPKTAAQGWGDRFFFFLQEILSLTLLPLAEEPADVLVSFSYLKVVPHV